ncbi:maleylpyruvate isomerase N-terminal domain-containing protein [Amycolatopsis suaedae]|uniref:Mycothiol-dependent maleylpyruvate isomerase metal-binding domain-containing protein n=1 Tax=Amycolatopsis suaedae TaxID=2510978 RepID=A0A4Q7J7D8_9PSEU|nr:maleylpyruvate isomerase N-terminal domain-containing protein [Amycolatopsis suaedae]RZQ62786.1 hypothetical protein EWH70_17740 [Amycolatopsis suaedae]
MIREDFLAAARAAGELLRDPAVAARWDEPSALADFTVGGLAEHLAFQVLALPDLLDSPTPAEPTVPVLGHYERAEWIDADLDAEFNVNIRRGGEQQAAEGHAAMVARFDAALATMAERLPEADNRPMRLPFWGPWSLLLEDLLLTRLMELAVHSDDLAVSVGVATPELPDSASERVIDLLSRLAVRRHGPTSVLRALSRAERAPGTIAAF